MALLTAEQELAALEEALQQMRLGKSRVSVAYGEKSVSYVKADLPDLQRRIDVLKRQLGLAKPNRPFRVSM